METKELIILRENITTFTDLLKRDVWFFSGSDIIPLPTDGTYTLYHKHCEKLQKCSVFFNKVTKLKMVDIELFFNNGLTDNQKITINEIMELFLILHADWQAYRVKEPEMVEYLNTENILKTMDKGAYYFILLEFYFILFSKLKKYPDLYTVKIKSIFENYQTDRKELTTDSVDKKRNGENMQLDLLDSLFILAMTSGAKPTKLDRLKEDLRANTHIYNNKQITALTDVIYKSGTLHKNTKPPTFSKWKEQFCNIIDVEVPTAKAKQKAVQTEYTALEKVYYYLIP